MCVFFLPSALSAAHVHGIKGLCWIGYAKLKSTAWEERQPATAPSILADSWCLHLPVQQKLSMLAPQSSSSNMFSLLLHRQQTLHEDVCNILKFVLHFSHSSMLLNTCVTADIRYIVIHLSNSNYLFLCYIPACSSPASSSSPLSSTLPISPMDQPLAVTCLISCTDTCRFYLLSQTHLSCPTCLPTVVAKTHSCIFKGPDLAAVTADASFPWCSYVVYGCVQGIHYIHRQPAWCSMSPLILNILGELSSLRATLSKASDLPSYTLTSCHSCDLSIDVWSFGSKEIIQNFIDLH